MKGVKLMGLTQLLSDRIQSLRLSELELSKVFRKLIVWMNLNCQLSYLMSLVCFDKWLTTQVLLANFAAIVSPLITFTVVYAMASSISVAQAFTSLAIITLLTDPLSSLLSSVPSFAATLGCFNRIQEYLLSEERKILRIADEKVDSNRSFCFQQDPPGTANHQSIQLEQLESSVQPAQRYPRDTLLKIESCSFGEPPVLHDITVTVERASLTMISGQVGAGKSMLLKAMLGELPNSTGIMHKKIREVAYCAQSPWLLNASIQRNIVGESDNRDFDEAWYKTVIHVCDLQSDIALFLEGDQFMVGSNGISLSGGQKQRVVMLNLGRLRGPN